MMQRLYNPSAKFIEFWINKRKEMSNKTQVLILIDLDEIDKSFREYLKLKGASIATIEEKQDE